MEKIICDRCGVEIKTDHVIALQTVYKGLMTVYDLCSGCKHSLEQWVKAGV